jgi:3-mercaptopyruvate sulfurtransferase SseA
MMTFSGLRKVLACLVLVSLCSLAPAATSRNDGVKRISVQELSALLKKNKGRQVFVVDVRDAAAFQAGHIKGAVNIPYGDTESRWKEFPKDRLIVTYCS